MTNEGPPPSIAGPTPAAQPSQPARSPTSSSTKPAAPSHRPTGERRPPANIAGPTYKRQGTSGPPIRQDTSETTNTSAEPARKKEEKKVWGLGGVFPEREKRGMKEEKKEGTQARPPPQVRQASAAPTGTESYYYSPELEREDPFDSRKTREATYDNEEVQSREASRPPSPTRSRSSTICDEEAPEPSKESKEVAHDDEQDDCIEGKHKESRPQGPGHEGTNNEQSDGQVGGHLPADESGWEDQLDLDDEDPPVKSWWGSVRFALREPLAEWLGMLVVIVLGVGSNCQVNLSNNTAGSYSDMNVVWGMAVMVGIYVAGGVSGGHLNPAITVSLAVFRGFPWRMVPRYLFAQLLGAFCGALIIYANYKTAINKSDPEHLIYSSGNITASASLFITMPNNEAGGAVQGFFQEVLASAVLSIVVLALGDENNAPPGAGLGALILGLVIVAIGMSMGWLSQYATNPARDLGPRFALWCLGYGKSLWTHDDLWWLCGPICGTFVGSLIGCLAYDVCIFIGPGSPINSSANELKHALGLPILHNMVRSALHRDGEGPSSRRAMAKREAVIEEGLRPETGSSGAEDPMKRWAFARRKMRKAEEEGRERRKKRVEEIVREKERGTRASHAQRGGVGRKLTSE